MSCTTHNNSIQGRETVDFRSVWEQSPLSKFIFNKRMYWEPTAGTSRKNTNPSCWRSRKSHAHRKDFRRRHKATTFMCTNFDRYCYDCIATECRQTHTLKHGRNDGYRQTYTLTDLLVGNSGRDDPVEACRTFGTDSRRAKAFRYIYCIDQLCVRSGSVVTGNNVRGGPEKTRGKSSR